MDYPCGKPTFSLKAAFGFGFLCLLNAVSAQTPEAVRARANQAPRWLGMSEFHVVVDYVTAPALAVRDISIPGLGTNDGVLQMEDSFLFGIGGGINYSENVNLNGNIVYGNVKFDALWGDQRITGKGSMFNGDFGLDYYFLDGALTPFVSGGIGFSYFNSGVPSGPPNLGCWWDPWWGYVCSGGTPTHDDWSFAWKAGAGLRLDLENGFMLKVAYNVRWSKFGSAGTEAFPGGSATAGWKW